MSLHQRCCSRFGLNQLQQAISNPLQIYLCTYPPPTFCGFIHKYNVHTHTSSLFKSSFSSSVAAVTGALRMGRVCDTHIDRSVTDKELGDERVTGLPHNDRWWISQTDSLTTGSGFLLFSFVHSIVTSALKFHTGIWCEQKRYIFIMYMHNQGSSHVCCLEFKAAEEVVLMVAVICRHIALK